MGHHQQSINNPGNLPPSITPMQYRVESEIRGFRSCCLYSGLYNRNTCKLSPGRAT